ncbi:c-type cytochrome [Sphingomonas psychrotolerans]|uniref:C-type cytochrome n=1 Tax=Sphingomonas psychrotolerans TaxID=1327635 RepID=A0ABU3NB43_9SPHN|nr:c-type cytochrome [Sphingomonas psychrotolerans]MDT8761012.1 c-type cytochrome [Sphingomonas psychrotolerans]
MKSLFVLAPVAATMCAAALTALPAAGTPPVADQGAQVFATCRTCHTLQAGARSGIGPNLNGVFGRKAGALPGYNFTPALKKSNITWNAQTLDKFLAAPTQVVPGTRMVMKVAEPAKRAALIAYLKAETSK